jgi:succinyl-diaminopimelate desuccinylase
MKQEIVELSKRLIEFKTVKSNLQALNEIVDFCEQYFLNDENKEKFVIKRFEKNEKPSLVITFQETKSPEIFLIGHLDVVEAEEHMFVPKIEGNKLIGRGSGDMKGMDAVMMVLMKELAKLDSPPSVGLMLTTDEEIGGFNGVRYLLNEQGYSCRCAFVPDGGDNFELIISEKGVFHFKVRTKGKAAHGSRPWEGKNAIDEVIEIYQRLREKYPNPKNKEDWKISLNLGKIQGGETTNTVADSAELYLDLRYPETEKIEEIKENIKGIVQEYPGAELEEIVEGSVFSVSPDNDCLRKWRDCAREVLGREIEINKACGASDARFLAEKNIPAIICKPDCGPSHAENEYIVLDSLEDYFKILWKFIVS